MNTTSKKLGSFFILNLVLAFTAIGDVFFFNPHNIAGGGLWGLGQDIFEILKLESNKSTIIGLIVIVFNIPLLIYSYYNFERSYFDKSVYATLALPFFDIVIEQGMKFMEYSVPETGLYTATALGTVIQSFGIAFVLYLGGSTGGLDIIARILNKYFKWISFGMAIVMCSSLLLAFHSMIFTLEEAKATLIAMVATGFLVDILLIKVFRVNLNEENK